MDKKVQDFLLAVLRERSLNRHLKLTQEFFLQKLNIHAKIYLTGMLKTRHDYREKFVLLDSKNTANILHELNLSEPLLQYLKGCKATIDGKSIKDHLLKNQFKKMNIDLAIPLQNSRDHSGGLDNFVGFILGKVKKNNYKIKKVCDEVSPHLAAAFTNGIYFHLNNQLIEKQNMIIVGLSQKSQKL